MFIWATGDCGDGSDHRRIKGQKTGTGYTLMNPIRVSMSHRGSLTISELEEIYPAASAKSKVDEAFKERAHQATLKLSEGI